jgi:hypothetical protein
MNQLTIEIILIGIGLFIYRYRNEKKRLINTISVLVIIVLVSRHAMNVTPYGYIIYKLGAMGLGVAYWNRFEKKHDKRILDYIKFGILIMLALYPLNALFLGNGTDNEKMFFLVFTIVTLVLAAIIIINDKWNIKSSGIV